MGGGGLNLEREIWGRMLGLVLKIILFEEVCMMYGCYREIRRGGVLGGWMFCLVKSEGWGVVIDE